VSHKYFYEVVEKVRSIVGSRGTTIGFGHVGDSNVHINVAVEDKNCIQGVFGDLEEFLYKYLEQVEGSISAEHGVGLQKASKLHFSKSPQQINLMVTYRKQNLKRTFDPKGILNPYKVIK